MNRADWGMVLNQTEKLGDTMLQNRVLAQQDKQRGAELDLRKQELQAHNDNRAQQTAALAGWRDQQQDAAMLQNFIKANADGSLDDEGRNKANQWIAGHQYFGKSGLQLVKPPMKEKGEFKTAPIANTEHLQALRQELADAKAGGNPDEVARIEQRLNDFMQMAGRAEKTPETEMETVTEVIPADPGAEATPDVPGQVRSFLGVDALAKDKPALAGSPGRPATPEKRISYKQPRGTGAQPAKPASAPAADADGKVRVISPDGKSGRIPKEQVQAALAQGFKLAQ